MNERKSYDFDVNRENVLIGPMRHIDWTKVWLTLLHSTLLPLHSFFSALLHLPIRDGTQNEP